MTQNISTQKKNWASWRLWCQVFLCVYHSVYPQWKKSFRLSIVINSNRKNSKTCKIHENMANSSQLILSLISGSCHLDSAANVEIGVECQIFVIVIFFNCDRVLLFGAHSRYYKGALSKNRSFLVICTTFRSDFHFGWKNQTKHSTLDTSFDPMSKWHEPDMILVFIIIVFVPL